MWYLSLKFIHVLSSTILFGTGLGSAFYFWRAHQRHAERNLQAMYFAARNVVIADWVFTTPAVIIQPITGFMLISVLNLRLTTNWIFWALVFYVLIIACWLPVVWLQIKMRDTLNAALSDDGGLPDKYQQYYRYWFWLGWPAFFGIIIIFYLMIFKSLSF